MRMLFIFSSGLLCGAFVRLGADIAMFRPGALGGEVFIVPLMLLLFWFGYQCAHEIASYKAKSQKGGHGNGNGKAS